jgi:hypothetical protein
MAGVGETYTLSDDYLRGAFERAQREKKDFLIAYTYGEEGMPWGYCPMIDIHESCIAVTKDTMRRDLLGIYAKHSVLNISRVYDLSCDFENACGGTEKLPYEVDVKANAIIVKADAVQGSSDQPFWKRWFTRPKI